MKNFTMKSFKSMKVVKMLNAGLLKFSKLINMKPHLLYIILGLITVILVALGLGTRREGFDTITNAKNALPQIVDNMNGAINSMAWNSDSDKSNFITNINFLFSQHMIYLVQQGGVDLQTFDKNNNQLIFKLNPAFQGTKDVSGNRMPFYVDDSNTEQPTPQFLQQYTNINTANSITKAQLNVLRTQITNRINNFSSMNPNGQIRLQTAFDALLAYGDNLGSFLSTNPNTVGAPSFVNILSQGTMSPVPFSATPAPTTNSGNTNVVSTNVANSGNTVVANSGNTVASNQLITNRHENVKYDVNNTNVTYATVHNPNAVQNPNTTSPWGNAGAGNVASSNGITQSNIPPGSQDMYLLKTQATPPSNPPGASSGAGAGAGAGAGSTSNPSPSQSCCKPAPVPPCPPCERCPEPAFDCKKVPNYNSASVNQYLPQPVLADFSQFGM